MVFIYCCIMMIVFYLTGCIMSLNRFTVIVLQVETGTFESFSLTICFCCNCLEMNKGVDGVLGNYSEYNVTLSESWRERLGNQNRRLSADMQSHKTLDSCAEHDLESRYDFTNITKVISSLQDRLSTEFVQFYLKRLLTDFISEIRRIFIAENALTDLQYLKKERQIINGKLNDIAPFMKEFQSVFSELTGEAIKQLNISNETMTAYLDCYRKVHRKRQLAWVQNEMNKGVDGVLGNYSEYNETLAISWRDRFYEYFFNFSKDAQTNETLDSCAKHDLNFRYDFGRILRAIQDTEYLLSWKYVYLFEHQLVTEFISVVEPYVSSVTTEIHLLSSIQNFKYNVQSQQLLHSPPIGP